MNPDKPTARAKGAKLQFGILPETGRLSVAHGADRPVPRFRRRARAPHEVTPGLFGVLVIIEANPDLKQSELARATHLDRSTVVTIIDNLERRGLVERRAALHDRRSNATPPDRSGR
jgi:hypothetical protein